MSDQIIKSGKERRRLKASAKTRNIDVKIGKNGLSKNVLLEIKTILGDVMRLLKTSWYRKILAPYFPDFGIAFFLNNKNCRDTK